MHLIWQGFNYSFKQVYSSVVYNFSNEYVLVYFIIFIQSRHYSLSKNELFTVQQ